MTGQPTRPLRLEQISTRLRDGTAVRVRPIRPDDKPLIVDGFDRMSEQSRFRRFMAPIAKLTDGQLRYLTEVDAWDHFAWIAVLRERPDVAVGVARYVRLPAEPSVAEAALTVIDDWQGKGLGTLMLGLLAVAARTAGIDRFRAYVLTENEPMREMLEDLGAEARHDSPGVLRLDVPLSPDLLPDSPAARVLKFVAANLDVGMRAAPLETPPGP